MSTLAEILDRFNFRIPFRRWHLFEFTDLWVVPPFIKHDSQDALVARWTKRLPLIQAQTPAELAADAVNECLEDIAGDEKVHWKVIDFESGTGGPVPVIDKLVNHGRGEAGKAPIPFLMSDSNPYLDAWMLHSAQSRSLSFLPNPVNAAYPTFSAISATTAGDKEAAARAGLQSNGSKVFRLYCATFHHFNDPQATKVLKSTMETSDAFAIIELQERTILSLLLVLLGNMLLMAMAIFWFWDDRIHLLFTYFIPLLPVTQFLDGIVACLRARTFQETIDLAAKACGEDALKLERNGRAARLRNWEFKHSRMMHTWPAGYMTVTIGIADSPENGLG